MIIRVLRVKSRQERQAEASLTAEYLGRGPKVGRELKRGTIVGGMITLGFWVLVVGVALIL